MADNHNTISDDVLVALEGHVLKVTLNRPSKKNALTHSMYTSISNALLELENNNEIRVLYLTGTQDCFTSGNDMKDFMHNPPTDNESPVSVFLKKLANATKPIVAAVNGPAVGVGTTLLLHCDLVYVGESAQLQMPFVSLGLCPEAGSSFILPKLVGHRKAAELLMLGERFGADEAVKYNIANAVFSDQAYQEKALAKAHQLASQPAASIRLTKQLLKQTDAERVTSTMAVEGAQFMKRLSSPEAVEAMQAFMQKRKPDFSKFN